MASQGIKLIKEMAAKLRNDAYEQCKACWRSTARENHGPFNDCEETCPSKRAVRYADEIDRDLTA